MTILCYHAVQPDWESPMAMEPQAFAEHAEWLVRRTTVVPLQSAVRTVGRDGRLPRGTTALTFDDGFAGLHAHLTPVLSRLGIPATVFLVAETLTDAGRAVDWVDTPPPYPLATLTLDQVRDMQAAGVHFESHSYSHLDLTQLSFQECVDDLTRSRELLESLLGHPVRLLAYPRGRHDASVRAAAERAGYSHAFTLPETREAPGPFAIPRVGIHRGNGVAHLRVKTARPYLGVRTSRGYRAAQHAVWTVRGARR
ncbi:MAG: hypothetical protein AVDCRST_MAG32-1547 [uncultured Nocardioides sp.]|uniref:NodB homology domain-containing protein n=1 Tax=uncultured Nocardioides sp. TaxID=198441 RepID=A0A6J4N8R3_9ACTN|nr:MAG: hypothetical protein AVDCRST_MAG32-1547 [uncultured Nocardioides sp.]